MSFPVFLDVAIGMSFIFLTLSMVASTINELIATRLKLRARYLEQGIIHLLSDADPSLAQHVINHPLLRRLGTDIKYFPAYIPSSDFVLALLDGLRVRAADPTSRVAQLKNQIAQIADQNVRQPILDALNAVGTDPQQILAAAPSVLAKLQDENVRASLMKLVSPATLDEIKQGIMALPDPQIQKVLLTVYDDAVSEAQNLENLKNRFETWFNDGMDRVSTLYKRYIQFILILLGVGICVVLNADALQIFNTLWHDPTARAAIVAQAANKQSATTNTNAPAGTDSGSEANAVTTLVAQITDLPLGWTCRAYNDIFRAGWKYAPAGTPISNGFCEAPNGEPIVGGGFSPVALILKIVGLGLMAGGVSFGAPFWFGVINKLVPLRADKPKS
jgi:hypothetical protein